MSELHVRTFYRFRMCKPCGDRKWHEDILWHHFPDGFGVSVKKCQTCKIKIYEVHEYPVDKPCNKMYMWLLRWMRNISLLGNPSPAYVAEKYPAHSHLNRFGARNA